MDFSPSVLAIGLVALFIIVEAVALVWLWIRLRQMQRLCHHWHQIQVRQQSDVIGLCAAAVRMDERLQQLIRDLDEIREQSQEFRQHSEANASYQAAIERIKEGCGIEELLTQCGLTREEANLLLRLYGERQPEAEGHSRRD